MRELRLAGTAVVLGIAIFRGGSTPWVGLAALLLALALAAPSLLGREPSPRAVWPPLAALVAFVAWQGVSLGWSVLPDRTWDYLDLGLIYLAFVACGVLLGVRGLAPTLAVVLGATVVWALAAKVFPGLYPDYGRAARLRAPLDYWNALALLGDFALPLGLWLATRTRARVGGLLLAFAWIVAILLAFSRGGVLVAVVVCVLWLAFDERRADSLWALLVAGIPAAVVGGLAFLLHGIVKDGQSDAVRTHDGWIFGLIVLAGAVVVALLARVRVRVRLLLPVGAVVVVLAVAAVAVNGSRIWHEGPVGSGSGRLASASSNFRTTWWKQAAEGFAERPFVGSGAGSFAYTNLRKRTSSFDEATEPHDLPLQFASETGIVGLLLFAALVALAARAIRPRGAEERSLALVPLAYLLHGLLDYDWDFVAVTGPALLVLGALLARPAAPPRRSLLGAGFALAGAATVFASLLLPWLAEQRTLDAYGESPARVLSLTDEAHSLDPFAVEPIFLAADAEYSLGHRRKAWALYLRATRVQPDNKETWFRLGQFELGLGCPRYAFPHLERFTELDPQGPGGELYREARVLVNSGKPRC